MVASDVFQILQRAGIALSSDGETLTAQPKERITAELYNLIADTKLDILALLSSRSDYWLIGGVIVVGGAPALSLSEVQARYPNQRVEPMDTMPRDSAFSHGDSPKVARLQTRLEALKGVFYDNDEILRALQLMAIDEGLHEVALCVLDAERQIAGVLTPISQQGPG
jgi:hypothetical protein